MSTPSIILSSPWGATATGCRQEVSSKALQREVYILPGTSTGT